MQLHLAPDPLMEPVTGSSSTPYSPKPHFGEMLIHSLVRAGVQCGAHLPGGEPGGRHPGLQVWARLCRADSSNHHLVHPCHICHHLGQSLAPSFPLPSLPSPPLPSAHSSLHCIAARSTSASTASLQLFLVVDTFINTPKTCQLKHASGHCYEYQLC